MNLQAQCEGMGGVVSALSRHGLILPMWPRTLDSTQQHYRVWKLTPYISFTTSPEAVRELAYLRLAPRGAQTLTVLNPNARIADGLPYS